MLIGILVALSYAGLRNTARDRARTEAQMKVEEIREIERLHLERDAAENSRNSPEGSYRGKIEGKDVEWHIIEFFGEYRRIRHPSQPGNHIAPRDGSLYWGDHSRSFRLSPIPGFSALRFERLSGTPESDGETSELKRVNDGIEALIARKDSKGVIGGDRIRSLYLILSKADTGWGIVDMDDIGQSQSLREKLNRLLDR